MDKMIAIKLYFGRDIANPDRDNVSDEMFDRFLREKVDPVYPGYTVYSTTGSWQGKREKSNVLEILVDRDDMFEGNYGWCPPMAVQRIRAAYCRLFEQDSVMVTFSPAFVEF